MSEARGKGFRELLRVDTALQRFFGALGEVSLPVERIDTLNALGRVLAADVKSQVDLPPFDRAAMDGYAVWAEDTFGATSTSPILLRLGGKIEIGTEAKIEGGRGQAVSIVTGAPMPRSADAVVMLEYSRQPDAHSVEVLKAVTPRDNVSRRGEDVQKDTIILRKGTILKPQDLGIMAGIGQSHVDVVKLPVVSVLSTGDELTETGSPLTPGKIFDVNRPVVISLVKDLGCISLDLGVSRDNPDMIISRVQAGLAKSDVVLISAGTSVGEKDLVPSVVNSLGKPGIIVHGVALRPGAPTGLAVVGGKPVVLLPGFPVAAMVAFDAFVKPLLNRMRGVREIPSVRIRARMLRRVPSPGGMRTYVRVKVNREGQEYVAEPIRTSGSGIISSMVRADGIVVIPEDKEGVEEGEVVEVIVLRPLG